MPRHIPEPQPQPQVHYNEEMDWSPSGSQHRAFSTYNPYRVRNMNPRFNDTPIEPKAGPIWYKVPPAPTTPAQRLRNPPLKPLIRESPKDTTSPLESIFNKKKPGDHGSIFNAPPPPSQSQLQSDFTLADPKFYAPEPQDDPRDGLTRMFASSFSISPGPDDEAMRRGAPGGGGNSGISSLVSKFTGASQPSRQQQQQRQRQQQLGLGYRRELKPARSRVPRAIELAVLLAAAAAWVRALGMRIGAVAVSAGEGGLGLPVALAALGACLLVSVRLAADLLVDEQLAHEREQTQRLRRLHHHNGNGAEKLLPARRSVLAPSWANLASLQVVAALALMWTVWSSAQAAAAGSGGIGTGIGGVDTAQRIRQQAGPYGNALFGVVIAHQAWHVFS